MEDLLPVALLAVAALVLSIIALSKVSALQVAINDLKRRMGATEPSGEKSVAQPTAVPPPLPSFVTQPQIAAPARPTVAPKPQLNWESILGVKLFAWIGGFAFFLGIVFFVKYAFENNWITPAMRIVAGAIVGVALISVSLLPRIRRYRVPAQSLSATGVLILYADVYAAHSFYSLIPLTAGMALMWIVTAGALFLAHYIQSQTTAWLGAIGGFVTPFLFETDYAAPLLLFGYIAVLTSAIAAISALKRWNYLIVVAAIGSIALEFAWSADFFGTTDAQTAQWCFLGVQALFLAILITLTRSKLNSNWAIVAAALTGFAVLVSFVVDPEANLDAWDFGFMTLLLGGAGLIALAADRRAFDTHAKVVATVVAIALALTWLGEWTWHWGVFYGPGLNDAPLLVIPRLGVLIGFYVAIFLLFASTPYFCGTNRAWPWFIAAVAGPLQFWLVYPWISQPVGVHPGHLLVPHSLLWLVTLAFALPAAIGVWYLITKENVALASGDSRLASQGAAVVAFVSLVFPVQFHREWITLGWAIEGLLLILLFRWVPNRRLRAASLIIFTGAFVRLALNPAVFEYHSRTHTPIFNWYLYAYGIAAICLFLGARWFAEPREKFYERKGSAFLFWMSGIVLFLLMNIEIADYFSIGPTLTFSFSGNFARDMTYTIAWSLFAFGLVVLGIVRNVRNVRLVGIGLLCLAFAKLFLHDLDSLAQLYRIAALIAVAIIAIVASFVYQRFLLPKTKA
jgi:uncharacterized membrane protein